MSVAIAENTIECPFCKKEVSIKNHRLIRHMGKDETTLCVGSDNSDYKIRTLLKETKGK